jgi:hypothetical protein
MIQQPERFCCSNRLLKNSLAFSKVARFRACGVDMLPLRRAAKFTRLLLAARRRVRDVLDEARCLPRDEAAAGGAIGEGQRWTRGTRPLGYEDLGRYRRAAGLARGRRPVWDRRPQRRRNNAAVNSPDAAEGLSADIPKFVLQKSETVISVK